MPLASYRTGTSVRLSTRLRVIPRTRRWLLTVAGVSAALAGCGRLWPVSTTPTPAAPRDVFACAAAQATTLGYKVVVDTVHRGERALQATKVLGRRELGPDPNEYSRRDQMSISVIRTDNGSVLRVTAGTLAIEEGRRGPTDIDEPASVDVIAAADTVIARCRVSSPPTM